MTQPKFFKRLTWLSLTCITLLLVWLTHDNAIAQSPRSYQDLTFPPLSEIQIPPYERYQLDNGMVVYLMEDHQLPLISGNALIRTGSRLEPGDKVGLAEMTGALMRTGGTQQNSPAELNEQLEQRAAEVETSIGTASGNATFNALSDDLEAVFPLFAQIIREPAFDPKQLELVKTQQRGEIARRNDNPGDIASREFRKLIYGETSPYARTTEYETLDNINREDVIAYYQQYVRPDQIILGIVGDFDAKQMKALIQKEFGDWQPPTQPAKITVPPAAQKYSEGVFFVDLPQVTQSNILLGHLGGKFDNPDYPALSVLNEVINGFGGRLFNEVRSRQGLAYSVYGLWNAAYDYPGVFFAGGQTRSPATVPLIQSLLKEIEHIKTTPISSEELTRAKESIVNSFVFKFENPSQTLNRLMTYEYYDYPQDFIFQYQQGVKATTVEDVQRVAQKYLQSDRLVMLVVGNTKEIEPSLADLGTKTVPLSLQ